MPYAIGIDARKLTDFGIGTYILNLVTSLAEIDADNRYVLFVGKRHREMLGGLPDNFRVVVESAPVYSARELIALSWRLLRLRLDLYHATHYVLPAVVPCRAVVTIHDIIHLLYPEYLPNALAFLYAKRMIHRSLVRGDRIIAVSQNTRSDLMDYFKVGGEKIEVIYNGVSERFAEALDSDQVDRRLAPLGVTPPYLLFVGNPKPHKNLDNLIRAFARAQELRPFQGKLVCVGDRGNRDLKFRLLAAELGIEDRLMLLGHVEDDTLTALYQGASLFLYPTLYEGFGLPVVEAMASGVPVVTSSTSALQEVARGCAELVEPLDVEAIARAISRCMADPTHREQLVLAGRKRARDFRWRLTAERTLAVYRKVLGDESPAS
jgi:glycosyltransferase involved in cell wall biosynthesis